MADKKADLAGPGIGNYSELEKILPQDYSALLTPKETQKAVYAAKNYIEELREFKPGGFYCKTDFDLVGGV